MGGRMYFKIIENILGFTKELFCKLIGEQHILGMLRGMPIRRCHENSFGSG
jgi:hypothetical protein